MIIGRVDMVGIMVGIIIIYAFTFSILKSSSDADDYMLGDKQYKYEIIAN